MRAGQGDMFSQYGQLAPDGSSPGITWSEMGQGRMGGSPWEFRERYLENSPMYQLDRIQIARLLEARYAFCRSLAEREADFFFADFAERLKRAAA